MQGQEKGGLQMFRQLLENVWTVDKQAMLEMPNVTVIIS